MRDLRIIPEHVAMLDPQPSLHFAPDVDASVADVLAMMEVVRGRTDRPLLPPFGDDPLS